MKRAAVYIRRSTEEHQVDSLATQLENAKRYIDEQGWLLAQEHVFEDSGVSRAEFKNRPGLIALSNAAKDGVFDVVVIRDQTRLGGDMVRTTLFVEQLNEAGCQLIPYTTGLAFECSDAQSKLNLMILSFAAELEREQTSNRTRENHERKARAGLNTGGRCFGYRNVPVYEGDRRARVEYEIHDEQASIVREIFERYAVGEGLRSIAKTLNGRGVPGPRGYWKASGIRPMLQRQRYRGVIEWGKTKKGYRGGTKIRTRTDPCTWQHIEAPHMRIVDDELWGRVQARLADNSRVYPKSKGGRKPKYLLSRILRCSECGGPMKVVNGKASHKLIKVYICANYHNGKSWPFGDRKRCPNSLRRPVDLVDSAVLGWVQSNLRERLVLDALREVRRRLRQRYKPTEDRQSALKKQASARPKTVIY